MTGMLLNTCTVSTKKLTKTYIAPYKGIGIKESWTLESGIQLKDSGIPLTIGMQNPSSTEKDSSTWIPESVAWNPESWIPLYETTCNREVLSVSCISITLSSMTDVL